MKVLHSADWHVGMVSWKSWSGLVQPRSVDRTEEIQRGIERIVEEAEKAEVDLVLLAGDLFDSKRPSAEHMRIVFSAIKRLADVAPVVVVKGNHDWDGLSMIGEIVENVFVFDRPRGEVIKTRRGDVFVYGIPYISGKMEILLGEERGTVQNKLFALFQKISRDAERLKIEGRVKKAFLVMHVMASGYLPPSVEEDIGVLLTKEMVGSLGGFDYVALGHVHTFNPDVFGTVVRAVYPGSLASLDFDSSEIGGEKGFVLYDADERDIEFVNLETKRLGVLDLSGCTDPTKAFERIDEFQRGYDYVKVVLGAELVPKAVEILERFERVVKVEEKVAILEDEPVGDEMVDDMSPVRMREILEKFAMDKMETVSTLSREVRERAIEILREVLNEDFE